MSMMLKRLSVLVAMLSVVTLMSSCYNPVNSGYRYAYPASITADSVSVEAPVGITLHLNATMVGSCWEVDRVQTKWLSESVVEMRFLCRHDISAPCSIENSTIKFDWPIIAPKPGTYVVQMHYGNDENANFTVVKVTVP